MLVSGVLHNDLTSAYINLTLHMSSSHLSPYNVIDHIPYAGYYNPWLIYYITVGFCPLNPLKDFTQLPNSFCPGIHPDLFLL